MRIKKDTIPLKVLIVDADNSAAISLEQALKGKTIIVEVWRASTIEQAQPMLRENDINSIYIDPLGLGIEEASNFIFGIRNTLPEIVFVLYMNIGDAEKQRAEFYRGERSRFTHYYKLDKRTPIASFDEELENTFFLCQSDLSWRMSKDSLKRLLEDTQKKGGSNKEELIPIQEMMTKISEFMPLERKSITDKSVFLSYRFAENEYIIGLTKLLEKNGFKVVTGKSSNTYISKAILSRIKDCQFFLCLMTKDKEKTDGLFTTSPWLLEEKGAALAFGKQIVLMIEEGVSDLGGLQGDWQRIHFAPKGFLAAALEAVEQLKSYVGEL